MRRLLLFTLCTLVFACEKGPVDTAWEGEVGAVEALNGGGVSMTTSDDERTTLRQGTPIPPGATLTTGAGVSAQVVLNDGTNLILDGDSEVSLDAKAGRRAAIGRGRLVIVTAESAGTLRIFDRDLTVEPSSKVSVEVSPKRGSIAVLEGRVNASKVELTPGRAALVAQGSITPFTAWDLGERTVWLDRLDGSHGFGKLESTGRRMARVSHSVSVDILGAFAQTEVVETFRNTGAAAEELAYVFELEEGAIPVEVAVKDGDTWRPGAFRIDKEPSAGAEDDDVEEDHLPFVSWADGTLRIESGKAEPNGEVSYRVRYGARLAPTFRGHRYRYPMPWDADQDLRTSRFSLRATVHGPNGPSAAVYGYDAAFEEEDDAWTASFEAEAFVPTGDFVVDLLAEREGLVVREKRGGDGFAGITIVPSFEAPVLSTPIDLVVVLDRSASRSGAQDGPILGRLFDRLPDSTRAAVVACAETCEPVLESEGFRPIDELRGPIDGLELDYSGVTNLVEMARVSRAIFEQKGAADRARRVLYVGDGRASVGPLLAGPRLARELEAVGAKFHAAGEPDDLSWVEGLAQHSGGTASELLAEDPDRAASGIVAALTGGGLTEVSVTLPDGAKSPYPNDISTFRSGEPITFAARAKQAARIDSVVVRGRLDGEDYEEVIGLDLEGTFRPFVSTIWAGARLAELEARDADLRAREVAREFDIPTKYDQLPARLMAGVGAAEEAKKKEKHVPKSRRYVATGRLALFPAEVDQDPYLKRMRQYRRALEPCVEEYGVDLPEDADVTLQMELGDGGEVESVRATVDDLKQPRVTECMLQQAQSWSFPVAQTDKPVRLTQPLTVGERNPGGMRSFPSTVPASERTITYGEHRPHTIPAGIHVDGALFRAAVLATERPERATQLDEQIARGSLFAKKLEPSASPVYYAYQSGRDGALETVLEELETGAPNVGLLSSAGRLAVTPARACAYRQAAASLQGESVPECPASSSIEWLSFDESGAEETTEPTKMSGSIELRLTNVEGERLMLIDLNRTRYWWFEHNDAVACRPLSEALVAEGRERPENATEANEMSGRSCVFSGLRPGLYGVHVIPGGELDPSKERVLTVIAGETRETIELGPERRAYVATIAIGEVRVEAPAVELPRRGDFKRRDEVFDAMVPMIAYCHLGTGSLPALVEVGGTVDATGAWSVTDASKIVPEARSCVKRAIEKVRLRGAPEEGAEVRARFRLY